MSDLRALARQRAALIATARATSSGTFDRNAVALSQPIGDATVRHLRQGESRAVARVSHGDATNATDANSTCRTVAPPIGSDNATPWDAAHGEAELEAPAILGAASRPAVARLKLLLLRSWTVVVRAGGAERLAMLGVSSARPSDCRRSD